ncbi:hypothetical protein [Kitasatospora sp. NPDC088134]|uniref:hypothetical protein n=1 Tax=Kitasatospora sp. NPDC088134 TaxID=3364071 RepID=UPI0037FF360F
METDARPRRTPRAALALAGAAVLALALAGCSDDKETMATWTAKGGQEQTKVIAGDIQELIRISGTGDAAKCRQLLDHVKTARAFRKLPDQDAQQSWEETLNRMETAINSCVQNPSGPGAGPKLSEAAEAEKAYRSFLIRIDVLTKTGS